VASSAPSVLGHLLPETGAEAGSRSATGFIKLVKMLIAPIVFATVVDRHREDGPNLQERSAASA